MGTVTNFARFLVIVGSALVVLGQENWVDYLCDVKQACIASCQVETSTRGGFRSLKPVEDCLWDLSGEHDSRYLQTLPTILNSMCPHEDAKHSGVQRKSAVSLCKHYVSRKQMEPWRYTVLTSQSIKWISQWVVKCLATKNSTLSTVRWSNFKHRDPIVGVFLRWEVQRRPHADLFLNESLPPKTLCGHHVHGRHGHGSPVKNRWRFSKFCEKYETLSITLKIWILHENGFKELTLVLFKSMFLRLHILFYNIFGQTIFWSAAKPWTSPKTFK
jgi:hypothetical protein